MIFVDTSAWFAAFVPNDRYHSDAGTWLGQNAEQLLTTDCICQFDDKQWSFTDCTSRVVIDRLSLPTAFAFDEHFRQFGNVTVVPA